MGRQVFLMVTLIASLQLAGQPAPSLWAAEGAAPEGGMEEGTGFSMFGTESIKGFDANKIEKDPVCDRSKRPKVFKVEPDEAAPGQKILIKGENFGTKECFHGVAFSATGPAPVQYSLVNETTIEVVVPEARPGMSFIDVVAGGGNARSKGFLIKSK
ncbi:MAG: IPT/TIG domain-containing protein [Nitrospiraceae bacterium]